MSEFLVLAMVLLAPISAAAAPEPITGDDSASSSAAIDILSKPSQTKKNFLSLELQQLNYDSGAQTADQLNQYTQVSPKFSYSFSQNNQIWQRSALVDGFAVLPMSSGTHFELALPNAYYAFNNPDERLRVSLGRELQNWSELDDFWHLGIWQPLARWDAAQPITQGLTGAFAQFSEEQFRMTLFASGLFLPDTQPDFKDSNGQITSDNRWFRAPASQIGIGQGESPLNFEIDTPKVKDVVLQRSLAIMTEFGRVKDGPFFKASLAQKPTNQFHVTEKGAFGADDIAHVEIVPLVVSEKVLTAETGFRFNEGEVLLSDTWERFENPNLPSSEYQQAELIDSQYVGAIAKHSLENIGVKKAQVALGYVQRIEETNSKTDTIIHGQIESSAERMAFTKLASVQFHKTLFQKYQSALDAEFDYVYSLTDRGEWVHLGGVYKYDRRWTWSLAADIFGIPASEDASTSFISKYRGNDRTMAGLMYVF